MSHYKTTISERTEGNLVIHVFTEPDEYPDLSYLEQGYSDCRPAEKAKYQAQDRARLEAYRRGVWRMLTVGCEISVKTKQNWFPPTIGGRNYIGGVESDSDPNYFLELAKELEAEARADLAMLKAAL